MYFQQNNHFMWPSQCFHVRHWRSIDVTVCDRHILAASLIGGVNPPSAPAAIPTLDQKQNRRLIDKSINWIPCIELNLHIRRNFTTDIF